ncbi:Protein of unknown function [Dyadobacter koreensis]|uniref:DUF1573 domain-containing protein n=1 Tax=Dyadobacter koreensis TaxID=408657 RepID=A0A1H6ZYJ2_9BACT|nr:MULTISPECIES: DUF1573 domain-containing protein [Dyadobacter]MCF2445283.1 DUF1573 domain-containing protein [Dyadobacter sp. CY345]SEJ54792.1 Protein of unknown function [Dyadobacter koreensis]
MKVFFSALVLLVGLTTVSFAQKGVLKFKEETHKFGKVPQGVPVTNEFVFTNTGTDPVVISNVTVSCGCTTPVWSKAPVLPGKTGIIKATFNAAAAGSFNKPVTVFSNTEGGSITLYLNGEVVAKDAKASTK